MVRKKGYHKVTVNFGNFDGITFEDYSRKIDEILADTVQFTKEDLLENIGIVPLKEGDLRNSVEDSIQSSHVENTYGIINFSSNLDYAKYVNNYEDHQVQHSIDPLASGHYQKHLRDIAWEGKTENWNLAKAMRGDR